MQRSVLIISAFTFLHSVAVAQNHAADLPTDQLLSQPGPTFRIADEDLKRPVSFVAYGDMRFTDPTNVKSTNPAIRKWLVEKIAQESPAAVFLNGDVPLAGDVVNDYTVYQTETEPWRTSHIRVYPALGNHEFHGPDAQQCLQNWWNAFPEFKNRRWYSVSLGSSLYAINLDSDARLLPESDQYKWVAQQLENLPATVDFVLISLHHPPVADIQTHLEVDHNPRPNEIALRDLLSSLAPHLHARLIVSAGHIHNYERNQRDDVTYLVSGGGGARPYFVERTPEDQYQSVLFPNYHYIKFVLNGRKLEATMYRISDPEHQPFSVEAKDTFVIPAKSSSASVPSTIK